MTPERLAEIKGRVEAATPEVSTFASGDDPDLIFTTHARTDVPDLLAEVERLTAELAKVHEAFEET